MILANRVEEVDYDCKLQNDSNNALGLPRNTSNSSVGGSLRTNGRGQHWTLLRVVKSLREMFGRPTSKNSFAIFPDAGGAFTFDEAEARYSEMSNDERDRDGDPDDRPR